MAVMATSAPHETLVWVTGATGGIGAALARNVPFPGARVINISRRQHPELETVKADLTDPGDWDTIVGHIEHELTRFRGKRAILVHNANYSPPIGFVGEVDRAEYLKHVLANAAAPLVIGDAFVRHCRPTFESGLVFITSAAARMVIEGRAAYGAAKAGVEQWVRVVKAERQLRGRGPWVVAIRPGSVDTETLRSDATVDPDIFPAAAFIKAAYEHGELDAPDFAAQRIWAEVPPSPDANPVVPLGSAVVPMPEHTTTKAAGSTSGPQT
jgi:benzil reductase ((S)-benzoin forming)